MSIKTKQFNKYGYKSLSIVCDKDEDDYNAYYDHIQDTKLATLHETGNGYIVKFPSHTSMEQPYYVCLDYSQADHLKRLLVAAMEKENE
jgi:hypothetical protein